MRAIFETLFDIVYLVTVITIGIRMIRGSDLCPCRHACRAVHAAAKPVAHQPDSARVGHLAQHPVCHHGG